MFRVGDKVVIKKPYAPKGALWPLKAGNGRIVHIFEAGNAPDPELIKIFYGIDEDHKVFKSVNKPIGVHRFVMQRDDKEDHFQIIPEAVMNVLEISLCLD